MFKTSKKRVLVGVAFLLMVTLGFAGCGGKKDGGGSSGGSAKKQADAKILQPYELLTNADALRKAIAATLTQQNANLKLWEDTATETPADRAAGHIARGVSNLKVTGAITENQLVAIAAASQNMPDGQLLRLDLSGTTGLTKIPDSLFFGYTVGMHLGSIILPEGITRIEQFAFKMQEYLMEVVLPDSLKLIQNGSFENTSLAKLVIPENCQLTDRTTVSSRIDCTVIFKEGTTDVELKPFGDALQGVSFSHNIYGEIDGASGGPTSAIKFVFPPSLKKFNCTTNVGLWDAELYELVNEIYSYALTPPVYGGKTEMFFKDVKTVYVPAEAVAAYEDAWFNITGAEFKPLPASVSTIEKWY
jgi:hypothetical protein